MHVCFLLYLRLCVLRNIKLLFLTLFLTTAVASPLFAFSQQVKDAQVLLNSLGFDAGPEDGLDGRKTKLALIEFYAAQQKTFGGQLSDNELFDLINCINAKALNKQPETVRYEVQESAGNYFIIILFFGLLAFVLFILRKKNISPTQTLHHNLSHVHLVAIQTTHQSLKLNKSQPLLVSVTFLKGTRDILKSIRLDWLL